MFLTFYKDTRQGLNQNFIMQRLWKSVTSRVGVRGKGSRDKLLSRQAFPLIGRSGMFSPDSRVDESLPMTAHYNHLKSASHSVRPSDSVFGDHAPPVFTARRRGLYRNGLKRGFDFLVVALALPVVLPIVLLLALLVALDGGQPFYRQARVGRNGRIYAMWKLRSMEPDAERKLALHLEKDPVARGEWDLNQKLQQDPRITRLGRFLRSSSMDELPQLWNVLKGDMSLVGPRPMMPEQQQLYPGRAYYQLRPGITGSWQVSARNKSTFADRAAFDTGYEQDVSFIADLKLLAATVRVVLRGTGY
jgi:exopolysaccharide production protein ExoY